MRYFKSVIGDAIFEVVKGCGTLEEINYCGMKEVKVCGLNLVKKIKFD